MRYFKMHEFNFLNHKCGRWASMATFYMYLESDTNVVITYVTDY